MDGSDFDFGGSNNRYQSFRDELLGTVETVLEWALEDMDGKDEVALQSELLEGNYGVEDLSYTEGLLEFTFGYEHDSDITVAAEIEAQEDEYGARVSYITSEDTEISDNIFVEPS
jgi:hypothetical protein